MYTSAAIGGQATQSVDYILTDIDANIDPNDVAALQENEIIFDANGLYSSGSVECHFGA